MSKLANVFLVPKTTQCPKHSPGSTAVCHKHEKVHRLAILMWSGTSTLVGFLIGIVLSWIRDSGYPSLLSSETLSSLSELQSIPEQLGWLFWVGLVGCVLIWGVATILVCARKYTTIQEYVIVGLATPCFLVSLVVAINLLVIHCIYVMASKGLKGLKGLMKSTATIIILHLVCWRSICRAMQSHSGSESRRMETRPNFTAETPKGCRI